MDKDHPEWLTEDFLNQCIRSKERYRDMTATSFTAESAVPPGNNYGSHIVRVRAELRDKARRQERSLSLIVKCPLTSGTLKEVFDQIYDAESAFYSEFQELGRPLLSRSFVAEHFQSPIAEVVVLEDLKEKGFVMAEKQKQLDLGHCRLYVTAAANLHAMSLAVQKQHPDLIERISKEKLFSNYMDPAAITTNKNLFRYAFESFAKNVSGFLENDRIPGIVRKCSTVCWDLLVDAVSPNETFNTLNQGDPWLTNMMFRRDEDGAAYDIKLVDFQCLRYASPISDLVFFIWTSANYEVLQDEQDTLHELYLDCLNDALEEMHLEERLTMKTVKEHVARQSVVALWAVAIGRPMTMKSSFTDMDAMYSRCKEYSPEHNQYEEMYTESFCKNHLPLLVQYLDNSGIFDYLESALEKYNG